MNNTGRPFYERNGTSSRVHTCLRLVDLNRHPDPCLGSQVATSAGRGAIYGHGIPSASLR